jgi:aerobic C4-dicarboxylate transport protein
MTTSALAASPPARGRIYHSLFLQVLAGAVLGILIGVYAPDFAKGLKIFSDGFLKLITMIVAPIVFCVVVHGIAGAGDLKKVGRLGLIALVYFEAMTTVALTLGVALGYLFAPGHGLNRDPATLDPNALAGYAAGARKLQNGGLGEFLLNIVPTTVFDAFGRNDVLQVLFFAILFGVAVALVGAPAKPISEFVDAVSRVLFRIMGLIVRLAPLGVLGAVAYTVGQNGVGSLQQLLSLVALFYLAVALFVFVILGAVLRVVGLNVFRLVRYLREELVIVLATASSDAVLPQIMRKLEKMGVEESVVGLVIPTGYSFNLDAFSIYLTLVVVFIAQATNTPLSLGDLLIILGVSLVTSKGAHGVPGSAIVILAATLHAVPAIPAVGLTLVLSVDWFVGIARAVGNLVGNCIATIVVGAVTGGLDLVKARETLAGNRAIEEGL